MTALGSRGWPGPTPTSVQDFDDGIGFVDVQLQVLEPAVVHEVQEDVEPVQEGVVGFLLPPAGFVWVIFGLEPGARWGVGGRSGGETHKKGREGEARQPQTEQKAQNRLSIIHTCKAREVWGGGRSPQAPLSFRGDGLGGVCIGGELPEEADCRQGRRSTSKRREFGSVPAPRGNQKTNPGPGCDLLAKPEGATGVGGIDWGE